MNIVINKLFLSSIPCIIIKPYGNQPLNTIIFYHGWHSSKEDLIFKAKLIASFNYQVIVPDAIYHGDRDPIDYDHIDALDKYFWRIIKHTIIESDNFISAILKLESVKELVVMGSSMGGFSASGIFIRNQNVKGLLNINGGSSFVFAETLFRELEFKPSLNEIEKSDLSLLDPMFNLSELKGRYLFMFHGINDDVIPIKIQKNFYHIAYSIYKNKEKIKLLEYKGINHKMSMRMFEDIIKGLQLIFEK